MLRGLNSDVMMGGRHRIYIAQWKTEFPAQTQDEDISKTIPERNDSSQRNKLIGRKDKTKVKNPTIVGVELEAERIKSPSYVEI